MRPFIFAHTYTFIYIYVPFRIKYIHQWWLVISTLNWNKLEREKVAAIALSHIHLANPLSPGSLFFFIVLCSVLFCLNKLVREDRPSRRLNEIAKACCTSKKVSRSIESYRALIQRRVNFSTFNPFDESGKFVRLGVFTLFRCRLGIRSFDHCVRNFWHICDSGGVHLLGCRKSIHFDGSLVSPVRHTNPLIDGKLSWKSHERKLQSVSDRSVTCSFTPVNQRSFGDEQCVCDILFVFEPIDYFRWTCIRNSLWFVHENMY